MEKIDDLFKKLFAYYLISDTKIYSVRLEELRRKIKDTNSFSLDEIYNGIINDCIFFPTVANYNQIVKRLRDVKYEVLVKKDN